MDEIKINEELGRKRVEECKRMLLEKLEREERGEQEEEVTLEVYEKIKEMVFVDIDVSRELTLEEQVEIDEKIKQKERELLAKEIVKQQSLEVNKLYTKEDIMQKFSCESDKALKILRLAFETRFAIKIGKEYYISAEDFTAFITHNRGRNVTL